MADSSSSGRAKTHRLRQTLTRALNTSGMSRLGWSPKKTPQRAGPQSLASSLRRGDSSSSFASSASSNTLSNSLTRAWQSTVRDALEASHDAAAASALNRTSSVQSGKGKQRPYTPCLHGEVRNGLSGGSRNGSQSGGRGRSESVRVEHWDKERSYHAGTDTDAQTQPRWAEREDWAHARDRAGLRDQRRRKVEHGRQSSGEVLDLRASGSSDDASDEEHQGVYRLLPPRSPPSGDDLLHDGLLPHRRSSNSHRHHIRHRRRSGSSGGSGGSGSEPHGDGQGLSHLARSTVVGDTGNDFDVEGISSGGGGGTVFSVPGQHMRLPQDDEYDSDIVDLSSATDTPASASGSTSDSDSGSVGGPRSPTVYLSGQSPALRTPPSHHEAVDTDSGHGGRTTDDLDAGEGKDDGYHYHDGHHPLRRNSSTRSGASVVETVSSLPQLRRQPSTSSAPVEDVDREMERPPLRRSVSQDGLLAPLAAGSVGMDEAISAPVSDLSSDESGDETLIADASAAGEIGATVDGGNGGGDDDDIEASVEEQVQRARKPRSSLTDLLQAPAPEPMDATHLTFHVATWNMHEQPIPSSLHQLLFPPGMPRTHMYVVGTQEGTIARRNWEFKLQETLGRDYIMARSHMLMGIHLCLFVRRDLLWYLSHIGTATVATKLGGMLRTKGAVGISFRFAGTKFLLVDSHLAAHQNNVGDRNADFHSICRGLNPSGTRPGTNASISSDTLNQTPKRATFDVTQEYDHVIWLGDLNYRINYSRRAAEQLLSEGKISHLLLRDQLRTQRAKGLAFQGFQEGEINFPPTYKFDLNSDNYDTSSKMRVPSWTDRILFKSRRPDTIACSLYNCVSSLRFSDHRPVFAVLHAELEPMSEAMEPAEFNISSFDHDVYVKGVARRIASEKSAVENDASVPQDELHPTLRQKVAYRSSVCTIL